MLSVDTQNQMVSWILTLAREEKAIETIRQVLGNQDLFAPYTAFLRMDKKGQGFLDSDDLIEFLEYFTIIMHIENMDSKLRSNNAYSSSDTTTLTKIISYLSRNSLPWCFH